MLAHYAFKGADLVSGTRRVTRLPINIIRSLSDHTVKPSRQNQRGPSKEFKKDRNVHRKEPAQPAHTTHQLASVKTPRFTDESTSLGSPNYIPNQLRSFQFSIVQRDVPSVLRIWRSLEKDNLLHLLVPSDLESCSQLVINHCPVEPSSSWSGPSRMAVEELALGLANRLSTSALKACFTASIIVNDTEGVLRLYDRFQSQVEQQNAFEDEGLDNNEESNEELLAIPTIRISGSPVDRELSILAIMAHAIRDDFSSAIQTGLNNNWSLPWPHAANKFLDPFVPTSEFRQKVLTFLRHADAARLLSRPNNFQRHLSNLVRTPATRPLQTLYVTMVEGLSENYPWAVLDSESPSEGRPVTIPESMWAGFISAFLSVERLDLAELAWDDMVRYGHKPGPGVWTVLIKGVGKMKGSGPALTLWRSMKAASVSPDTPSYHAIIQVMANTRRWNDAAKLFDEFRLASSLPADPHSERIFNTMISAHLVSSRESDALGLLEEMIANGPHPTAHTFNTFLTYYYDKGNVKSLSSMLKKMAIHDVSGDVATFAILLCTLLRILDRGKAIQQTLAVMNQHKIKPNVATYTAIITSLLKEKDKKALEAALDLLRTMEESGDPEIAPNAVTYTAILNGVYSWIGRDDRLVQHCTELIVLKMKSRRVKFNRVTYNVLLKTCLENPSPAGVQRALQFYRQMRRDKVSLTGDTWHIILHGLAKRGEWVLAHEVLRDMQESGVKMTDWLENVAEEVARGYTTSRHRLASTRS